MHIEAHVVTGPRLIIPVPVPPGFRVILCECGSERDTMRKPGE
jgi:hypothetical protein